MDSMTSPGDPIAEATQGGAAARLTDRVTALELALQTLQDDNRQLADQVRHLMHSKMRRAALISLALHPQRIPMILARLARDAARTSRRAHWTGTAWVQVLDRRLAAKTLARRLLRPLRIGGARRVLYRVATPSAAGLPRPRIVHAIPNLFVGGSTQLLVDLMNAWGHAYDMPVMTSAMAADGVLEGVTARCFNGGVGEMVDYLRSVRPDLLHVHYWGDVDSPWYERVFRAAAICGVPIVENINTPVAPRRHALVARYVYVSQFVRDAFGDARESETVIYPGIDFDRFAARQPAPKAAESIGMVYRLERDKLNEASIEPLIQIARRRPATRVFVIGDGALFEPFLRRVTEAGVRGNFVFTGYVDYESLPDYYNQFSIFVAPVWKESFGQVTPFAMNMGLAVAGARVGALPEILGGDATLGDTAEQIADVVVSLLDDPERVQVLGATNRQRSQDLYDVKVMCARYGAVYAELLASTDPMPGYPAAEIFTS
jgi:glycosyltransferase involved in cell wall biosynthesis